MSLISQFIDSVDAGPVATFSPHHSNLVKVTYHLEEEAKAAWLAIGYPWAWDDGGKPEAQILLPETAARLKEAIHGLGGMTETMETHPY